MDAKRIHSAWPTWLVFLGLSILFVAERMAGSTVSVVGMGVATLAIAVAIGVRAAGYANAGDDKREARRLLLLTTIGFGVGIAMYAMIRLVFRDAESSFDTRMRGVLWAAFPIVIACSAAPLVAIEIATNPVAYIDRYEIERIRRSASRGFGLALLASLLVAANYLADRHDRKWDFSFGGKTVASEHTIRAVRDMTTPVRVLLFFPRASEVGDTAERYLDPLRKENAKLEVERVDHALAGELAQKVGVTENGFIGLLTEGGKEKIRLGTEIEGAKANLRKLDQNFLKALIKVSTSAQTAYFTVGHDERSAKPREDDARAPAKALKQQLEAWQYKVKLLGVGEGLASAVPNDPSIVFVLGPERPFLPDEIAALNRALDRGARMLIALEGERNGDAMTELLGSLGLSFDKTLLANEERNAPLTHTKEDHLFIWSNRYSSHASVDTMTRNDRLVTLFSKAGSLTKAKEVPARTKVDMVLSAFENTFRDANGDRVLDPNNEKVADYGLAAAVVRSSTTGRAKDEGRAFVIADADVFGDELLRLNQGNAYLLRDAVIWLRNESEPVAPTISEADIKIQHRSDEDAVLFYGTTFGVPAGVFAVGYFATRRRRRS